MKRVQPWIFTPAFDLGFILAPAFLITAIVVVFRDALGALAGVPPWAWLLLIVGVDVSHVYATLFRTYLDRDELRRRQALYALVPLGAWIAGCLLYSVDSLLFWRVLAYLAVFHFVRQQYGFMMIYARHERGLPPFGRLLDKAAIYLATLYPLVYWHCHARAFDWFVEGDFIKLDWPVLGTLAGVLYFLVLIAYAVKEIVLWRRHGLFNLPRNLLLSGTALSWFAGIVVFNNDLAFTATNVLAHGVPYLALIWIYGRNRRCLRGTDDRSYIWPRISGLFTRRNAPLYLLALAALAFLEEGLWDGMIWREHGMLFGFFSLLPAVDSGQTLCWLVPLLTLPQSTHYLLDAFIWRFDADPAGWKRILFYQTAGSALPERPPVTVRAGSTAGT
jgi:hypothetical protein